MQENKADIRNEVAESEAKTMNRKRIYEIIEKSETTESPTIPTLSLRK